MNLQDQLLGILNDLGAVKAETALILGAILLLLGGLVNKSKALIVSIYILTLLVALYFYWMSDKVGGILSDSLFMTVSTQNFSFIFLASAALILLYKRESKHAREFYFFVLSLLIGSIFMMKANSFLLVYLAVELTSFTSYILTNFSFRKQSYEAGIKYLLFGAVSTAIMLFGLGIIYGSTGTFFISEWNVGLFEERLPGIGLVFLIFGILFKASITPFHIWVPTTYQTAPNDATALLSIVPKLAALVLLQRINTSLGGSLQWFVTLILVLGIITIVIGTFSALRQTHARRMISFGAVAHSGFLLPLVFMNSTTANDAFWWYAVVYALMNLAIFYLLDAYEREGVLSNSDYTAHGSSNAIMGVAISVVLLSLIGLPPIAGFTAKFFLFTSLWEAYWNDDQVIYGVYLLVAVFATLISLFFYLRIPYYLFLVRSEAAQSINFSRSSKIMATLFSIALLLLFFAPQILTVMQQLLNSRLAHE